MEIEASFRRESARLVASLTKALGPSRLSLAEDVAQETFLRAMRQWGMHGVPPNPSAWLMRVAKNLAIDALRRERIYAAGIDLPAAASSECMEDAELEMLLMCCHSSLPEESQIAVTLKFLCGLSVEEIAKGLLSSTDAVSKRIARAKRALRALSFDPGSSRSQINAVLRVLYLTFNEGYAAASGPDLTRDDLCYEAILLADRLVRHPFGDTPQTHALLSLMLLHSSRLWARVGPLGELRLLAEQDRGLWDRAQISRGLFHLGKAAAGSAMTPYHCEAAIAACHATAADYKSTDWCAVLSHYSDLARLNPSGMVLLNRAVAVAEVHGPEAALEQLAAAAEDPKIRSYYLLPATRADLLRRLGNMREAAAAYGEALKLARNEAERVFLRKRVIETCELIDAHSSDY